MKKRRLLAAALTASLVAPTLVLASIKCEQARSMVGDAAGQISESAGDARALESLLFKLETARNLCPELGAAWKYSYCIAKTLGKEDRARYFRDRAVFNGVEDLNCSAVSPRRTPNREQQAASGAPGSMSAPPPGPVREKHALIVGIGEFKDSNISKLKYTAKDARDLYETLVDSQYGRFDPANVELLVDAQATREAILIGLHRLHERADADDLVLIFVSSHGTPTQPGRGLQGVGHILTHDTQADRIYVDALPFQDFSDQVATIPARRKVTFLDTCFSGQAFTDGSKLLSIEPLGVSPQTAERFLSGEGTYVVTSSTESQVSWESANLRNSYFTYYLIEALRASNTPLTLRKLFDRLAANVTRAVQRDRKQRQEPQLYPSSGLGDIRIGVKTIRRPMDPLSQGER